MHESYSEQELILIASTAIILILVIMVVAALLIQQKRKFSHRQELLEVENRYEKTLLETELKIQGETLKAVSRNLHDNIGSNISTAMLLLYKDEKMDAAESDNNRREALDMLDKIVDDLKNIARSLNPAYLTEIGLGEAIGQRVQQLERTKKYTIEFRQNPAPAQLDIQKQVILYYIFQEVVNNITTHARATGILIHLHFAAEQFTMHIKDNGRGITNAGNNQDTSQRGSGLASMKRHAEMINATLVIESNPGTGTAITLNVPRPYLQDALAINKIVNT